MNESNPIILCANVYTFLKIFGGHESFCVATDTPVLDFWWDLPWVSKPGWITHLYASSPVHSGCLRFTSGVTLADLLAVSMAASRVSYIHVAEVGCLFILEIQLIYSRFQRSKYSHLLRAFPQVIGLLVLHLAHTTTVSTTSGIAPNIRPCNG